MRDFVKKLRNTYGSSVNNLVGVELGVYDGTNAKATTKDLAPKKLYLIDPYTIYTEYTDYSGHTQKTWDDLCRKTMKTFGIDIDSDYTVGKLRNTETEFIRKKSEDAVELFTDFSLDFIYIDANHAYEYVKQDVHTWHRKVKSGGFIMGHDLLRPDVKKAVVECAAYYGTSYEDGPTHTEWWFQKV